MSEGVDDVWETFWKDLVCGPDGALDEAKVRAELFDHYHLMDRAGRVYDHVTGGRISKTTTAAEAVIEEADANVDRLMREPWFEDEG